MTMALLVISWYVMAAYHTPACPYCLSQLFTHGFPRADIHELLSPDLLHQIIKGTFKDHLVTWVTDYIKLEHPSAEAKQILADIDQRQVLLELIYF